MAEQIEIILSADASDVSAELQKAENNLKKFQVALKKATSVGEINYLTNNIKGLELRINSLNQSNQKFAGSSNKAAYALNDLSRIAQDAPYGFIGIQNNINPLLESFQRLKAESTGTGGALKSMAGALAGPAGIGLAVGVASALMVAFGDKIFKTGESVNHLTDVFSRMNLGLTVLQEELKNTLHDLDNIKEIKDLEVRLKITGTGDLADYRREVAKLNITQLDFVDQQSYVVAALDDQKTAFQQTSNILATAVKNSVGSFTSMTAGNPIQNQITALGGLEKAYLFTDEQIKNFSGDVEIALQNYKDQQIGIKKTEEQLRKLQFGYKLAATELKVLNQVFKDTSAAKKKKVETETDVLNKLNEDLRDQKDISLAFDKSTLPEQMRLVEGAIKKLISDFNKSPNSNVIVGLISDVTKVPGQLNNLVDFNELAARVAADAYYEKYQKELEQKLKNPPKDHTLKVVTPKLELTDIGKKLEDLSKELDSMLDQVGQDVAIGFATSLGDAMSGKGFESFFTNMYVVIAEGMINIGKAFVRYAIELGIIKKALETLNPVVALAGGLALIAFGTMLKNKMSKTQAFAVGTRNAPGGLSLVGERGPELVNIPRGASVIPAAQTSNMMGGMGGAVEVFGVLRGQDIYFSNKKYGLSYGRQT